MLAWVMSLMIKSSLLITNPKTNNWLIIGTEKILILSQCVNLGCIYRMTNINDKLILVQYPAVFPNVLYQTVKLQIHKRKKGIKSIFLSQFVDTIINQNKDVVVIVDKCKGYLN